jgi:K(+)-stimulated pyrophosphate-energized sodium pump
MNLLIFSFFSGFLAIFAAFYLFLNLKKGKISSPKMIGIASSISLGVKTYLLRQLKTVFLVTLVLTIFIFFSFSWKIVLTFIFGVFTSLSTAFLGMNAVTIANVQTADDAMSSTRKAFEKAIQGGSIMGLSITGFSLLFLSFFYFVFKEIEPLVGFGFGASLASLFGQIGGGIYTKSADIGADLVGKIEKGIPEDDPRNPAVIADLVGDNVGDCAGRGSDLFQTLSSDIITGMLVALLFVGKYGSRVIFLPLLLQSLGIISSIFGIALARKRGKDIKPENSFTRGLFANAFLATIFSFILVKILLSDISIFFASFLGIITMLIAYFSTKYYLGENSKPVKDIAKASERGAALNLITGLSYGFQSPIIPIVAIMGTVSLAFIISGESLLALVALNIGTDLLIGYIMTADVFGPITDNASGIAEMAGVKTEVIKSLSALDSVGNTMKATTKAYAMASGTSTSFMIFATFFALKNIKALNLTQPFALAFIFLGVCLSFLISSVVIGSTSKTALKMVDEVRRQFREIEGLIEGKAKPDYKKCIDIATKNALKEMILPSFISIFVPIFVGVIFGAQMLGALLIGAITSAALLGSFFNNLGGSFDNAKKLIEGKGLKGSFEHQAAVVADTVGDPLKDVAGPSLLIFMKLIGMTALLIVNKIH